MIYKVWLRIDHFVPDRFTWNLTRSATIWRSKGFSPRFLFLRTLFLAPPKIFHPVVHFVHLKIIRRLVSRLTVAITWPFFLSVIYTFGYIITAQWQTLQHNFLVTFTPRTSHLKLPHLVLSMLHIIFEVWSSKLLALEIGRASQYSMPILKVIYYIYIYIGIMLGNKRIDRSSSFTFTSVPSNLSTVSKNVVKWSRMSWDFNISRRNSCL